MRVACTASFLAVATLTAGPVAAQNCSDLFNEHQVLNFYVTMDNNDWRALQNSCPGGYCGERPHTYFSATFQCESGPQIQVGIRRKSGTEENDKPPLKIDINEFVPGQTFQGKIKLNLENGGESSGGTPGNSQNGIREGVSWLLYEDAGIVASRVAWVNVWVNGDNIGLYTHAEQIDKTYLSDRGIDDGGWLFKGPSNDQRTREGEPNPFAFNWYPFDHASQPDPQPVDWRDQTEWRVNVNQVLTLAAVSNFVVNKDCAIWKNNNYWYYDWSVFPEGQQPRLYLGWDLDTTLKPGDTFHPVLGIPNPGGHIAQAMIRDDPAWQAQYYAIYGGLLNGPLSQASTLARVDALEPVLTPYIDADPNQTAGSAAEQFDSVRSFLQARTAFVLTALGQCPDSVCQAAENPCTCPADCGDPPSAESVCTDSIDEDCDSALDCNDSDCSADPACQVVPVSNRIVVNEVLVNSSDSPDVEYVEVFNEGPLAQDLTGWYLLDDDNAHDPCLLDGVLLPGEYLVVAGFIDGFNQRFPEASGSLNINQFDSDLAGQGFGLGDGGDQVRLFRPATPVDEFVSGFMFGPQGEDVPVGFVPQVTDAPEHVMFPTPGATNNLSTPFSPICINEFLTTSLSGGVDDWIELYNRGSVAVDISGWYLSDDFMSPTKYAFPAGTSIPAGGYLVVDETELGFAFSSTGSEVIVLLHSDGMTGQDFFDYGTQFPDVTQGRFPDGTPNWHFFSSPSQGSSNTCTAPGLPEVEGLEFISAESYEWNPVFGATGYDIVKGDLGLLRSSSGDFSSAVQACASNNLAFTTHADLNMPLVGHGSFYLVRAVDNACGFGSYDTTSSSQTAGRDLGIQGAPSACP